MVLEYKPLVRGVISLAFFTVTDIAPVVQPCIIFMVCRGVLHRKIADITHNDLQTLLTRRAAIAVRLAHPVLIHTEIFRMCLKQVSRQKPRHGMFLIFEVKAFINAFLFECKILITRIVSSAYTYRIQTILMHERQPVYHFRIFDIIPCKHNAPKIEIRGIVVRTSARSA